MLVVAFYLSLTLARAANKLGGKESSFENHLPINLKGKLLPPISKKNEKNGKKGAE